MTQLVAPSRTTSWAEPWVRANFGKVRLARHKLTQELVAIKIMYKERIVNTNEVGRATKEIAHLGSGVAP